MLGGTEERHCCKVSAATLSASARVLTPCCFLCVCVIFLSSDDESESVDPAPLQHGVGGSGGGGGVGSLVIPARWRVNMSVDAVGGGEEGDDGDLEEINEVDDDDDDDVDPDDLSDPLARFGIDVDDSDDEADAIERVRQFELAAARERELRGE